jgi:hypothetical protein
MGDIFLHERNSQKEQKKWVKIRNLLKWCFPYHSYLTLLLPIYCMERKSNHFSKMKYFQDLYILYWTIFTSLAEPSSLRRPVIYTKLHTFSFYWYMYRHTHTHIYVNIDVYALEFELRASCLLGKYATTWVLSHASSTFYSCYFGDSILLFCSGWPGPESYFILPAIAGNDSHTVSIPRHWLSWGPMNFIPGWPQTEILLISAFPSS